MEKTEIVMDYEKKDFRKLYEDLVKSDWFKKAYHDKSLGDCPFDIPDLKESEDERIRKGLIEVVSDIAGGWPFEEHRITKKEALAYLEKQKERQDNPNAHEGSWSGLNTISSQDKDTNIDEIAQDYVDGVKEYNPEPTWDLMQTAVCYGYHYCEQKPISPCDIVPYIDDRIAELQDMWREEKVAFDWDDMHEMIEDVARHFYQKDQKPAEWSDTDNIGWDEAFACVTRAEKSAKNEEELQNAVTAEKWLKEIKFKYYVHPVKQEWSEEDKQKLNRIYEILGYAADDKGFLTSKRIIGDKEAIELQDFLKSLRPSWKPSEHQMNILKAVKEYVGRGSGYWGEGLGSLIEDLEKLM